MSSFLIAACGSAGVASPGQSLLPPPSEMAPSVSPPPSAGATPGTPLEAAQTDLDNLLVQLERIHPEPFHAIARAVWVAELEALKEGLGELTPEEAVVELQRLWALLAKERDGHQLALPVPGAEAPVLPIRIYEFDDGVFITDAFRAAQAELVGARIEAVNGHPIADVLEALDPLLPRDGPSTVPLFRPVLFLRTEVLRGLGLIEEGAVSITVIGADGTSRDVTLEPIAFDDYRAWAGDFGMFRVPERPANRAFADLDTIFDWTVVDGSAAYLRYTQMRPIESARLREVTDRIAEGGIERVILDLRQNPGGDNHNAPAMVSLLRDPAIDRHGRLFVLTDHVTFSAASNLSTQIEAATGARFVGEAMGGGLNFWNDVQWVRLPSYPVPMQVGISTRYWQFAEPDDPRLTIDPDIAVPNLAADYFADRDPVLEAALEASVPG